MFNKNELMMGFYYFELAVLTAHNVTEDFGYHHLIKVSFTVSLH